MMNFKTADGLEISGETYGELIDILWGKSKTVHGTKEEYLVETSKRAYLQTGGNVRTDSDENFVNDLVTCELLSYSE